MRDALEECNRKMILLVATFIRPNESQTIDGIGVDLLHSLELRSRLGGFVKNLTVFLLVFASVILAQTADVKVCVVKHDNSPIQGEFALPQDPLKFNGLV